ncbi:hypothetical protein K0M31_008420 [Melipona bicolor]|uniref:Uncharacterized protein n=1 Tax=Melipona bicolor TaxID=60889 RepID=A0AA40FQY5_9HYME|nr:hypothetical protein K0M31_008420 [Melipona bicolor]
MENVHCENDIYTDSRRYLTIYRACQSPSNSLQHSKKKRWEHKIRPPPNYRNLYVKPGLEIDTTQPEAPIQSQMGIGE